MALTNYTRSPVPAQGDLRVFLNNELAKIEKALAAGTGSLPITLTGATPANFTVDLNGQGTMKVGNGFKNLTLSDDSAGSGNNTFLSLTNLTDVALLFTLTQVGAGTKYAQIATSTNTALFLGTAGAQTVKINNNGNVSSLQFVDDGGTFTVAGYRGRPMNLQFSSYTFVLGDRGKCVGFSSGNTGVVYTVPQNVFSAGDIIYVAKWGSGVPAITVAQGTGTSLIWSNGGAFTTGNRTLTGNCYAEIHCVTTNTFVIRGEGIS